MIGPPGSRCPDRWTRRYAHSHNHAMSPLIGRPERWQAVSRANAGHRTSSPAWHEPAACAARLPIRPADLAMRANAPSLAQGARCSGRGPVRGPSHLCKRCNQGHRRHDSVVSVRVEHPERRAGLLIIRRSWVRAPTAPLDGFHVSGWPVFTFGSRGAAKLSRASRVRHRPVTSDTRPLCRIWRVSLAGFGG
jgi:hypothetical protein